MKTNFSSTIKNSALLYCVLFTVATLIDNILQLCRGQVADSNYHIMNRAVVILIAVITITIFDKLRLRNKILSHIVAYVISMLVVFAYVWFTSFFDPLSPDAYQGILIIYTAFAIIVVAIIEIKKRIKSKKQL